MTMITVDDLRDKYNHISDSADHEWKFGLLLSVVGDIILYLEEHHVEKRLSDIEARLSKLEFMLLPMMPLGPKPEDLIPDPHEIDRIVSSIEKAVDKKRKGSNGKTQTPRHKKSDHP